METVSAWIHKLILWLNLDRCPQCHGIMVRVAGQPNLYYCEPCDHVE